MEFGTSKNNLEDNDMRRHIIPAVIITAVFSLFVLQGAAFAQSKVKLEMKSKKGEIMQYNMQIGGTVNMDLTELPLPRAKMKIENLKGQINGDVYFVTTAAEPKALTFDVKAIVDKAVLGGLLKLDGLGFKSTALSSKITLKLAPTGKVLTLDMADVAIPGAGKGPKNAMPKIPGMDALGLGGGQMNEIITMLIGMMPPIFSNKEVGVGDTWKQEIKFDEMGLGGILPNIPFNFKLVSIDNGVANIDVTTKGTFDGKSLNGLLALIPELPMGDDILKIGGINLLVNWDSAGNIKFNIAAGRFEDASMSTSYDITLGAKTSFKHTDNTSDDWNSDGKINIIMDFSAKYAGAPNAEDVDGLFAAPEEQGEEGGGSDKKL